MTLAELLTRIASAGLTHPSRLARGARAARGSPLAQAGDARGSYRAQAGAPGLFPWQEPVAWDEDLSLEDYARSEREAILWSESAPAEELDDALAIALEQWEEPEAADWWSLIEDEDREDSCRQYRGEVPVHSCGGRSTHSEACRELQAGWRRMRWGSIAEHRSKRSGRDTSPTSSNIDTEARRIGKRSSRSSRVAIRNDTARATGLRRRSTCEGERMRLSPPPPGSCGSLRLP